MFKLLVQTETKNITIGKKEQEACSLLNCNYKWQNRCSKCTVNYPKTVGDRCPDCGYKLRTTSHDTKRVEKIRY